jgi:hypothetical protein
MVTAAEVVRPSCLQFLTQFDREPTVADQALDMLVNGAPSAWVTAYRPAPTLPNPEPSVWARATARLPGGRPLEFLLEISVAGRAVSVTERPRRHLPHFCPNRHLFADGSFCLGLDPLPAPRSLDASRMWWRVLGGYLDLQVEAGLLGEWNPKHAWPHAYGAARALQTVEGMEAKLPMLVAEISRRREPLPGASQPCPCGSKKRAERCHLRDLQETRRLRGIVRTLEAAYWDQHKGTPCCGTLKSCPLRQHTPIGFRSRTEYLGSGW